MAEVCLQDVNNNPGTVEKSYSLRPRSGVTFRRIGSDDEEEDPKPVTSGRGHRKLSGSGSGGSSGSRPKRKSVPLSKYKRKNANARERCRMREINEAFESLRKAIPSQDDKMTKIATLKLAMSYISALSEALSDDASPATPTSSTTDISSSLTPDPLDDFSDHCSLSDFQDFDVPSPLDFDDFFIT